MRPGEPIGVGVVGLGFMGRTHVGAYRRAAEAGLANRLVAVCDASAERLTGRTGEQRGNLERRGAEDAAAAERVFDPSEVLATADFDELLACEAVDLVSVCTHTDSHVELATRALAAGKHVLVEKPVARTADALAPLVEAAARADTVCMPALCMRFWPGWDWLREQVASGALGRVRSAVFRRLGSPPAWAPDFYRDSARTGGALVDLHVHDVDFVRWCFGDPDELVSAGDIDHVTSLFRYADGPEHVVVEGGWDHAPGFPFRMSYTVIFEGGTADFDLGREQRLVLARDGAVEEVPLADGDGYDGEVRHLLRVLREGGTPRASVADAVGHMRLLELERESLARGGAPVRVLARG